VRCNIDPGPKQSLYRIAHYRIALLAVRALARKHIDESPTPALANGAIIASHQQIDANQDAGRRETIQGPPSRSDRHGTLQQSDRKDGTKVLVAG
jgi:hypothetical protein